MLNNLIQSLVNILSALQQNAYLAFLTICFLWGIQIVNFMVGYRLNFLGIYPRRIWGLFGIIFSPFLHASFSHLFFNSIPLFVLLDFVLLGGITFAIKLAIFITVVSGSLIWLFGRNGIHVGASALIMGYLSYLLVNAYHNPSLQTLLLGAICLYYFGSLLLSVFPQAERVSWEGHLFGLLAGIGAVFWLGLPT